MLDDILEILQNNTSLSVARKVGNNEIVTRCLFCGDSIKSHRSAHLYITVKDDFPLYYCQRCGTKGVIDNDFLSLYSVGISEGANIIKSIPKTRLKNKNNINKDVLKVKQLLPTRLREEYTNKMDYFTKRTGLKAVEHYSYLKVIYSFRDFVNTNKKLLEDIGFSMSYNFISNLDDNYIGFLTHNNRSIVFRNVNAAEDKWHRRYYHIMLDKKQENEVKFYNTPVKIDKSLPLEVYMCEGIFDVINLRTKYWKKDVQQVFIAVLNKDYRNKISMVINEFGMNINNIKFFLDSDHTFYKQFEDAPNIFTIYKNSAQKDYGEISDEWRIKKIAV